MLAAALLGFALQTAGFAVRVQPAFALANRSFEAVVELAEADPGFAEDTVRARLRLLEVDGEGLPPWRQPLVQVDEFPDAEPGRRFAVTLLAMPLARNDYFYSNLADGVYLEAECLGAPHPAGQSGSPVYALRRFQARFAANAARYLPREEGGVLAAIASGDKSRLTDAVEDDYRAAGISHLLVVSGLHLSLVCGVLSAPGGRLRRLRAVLSIGLVLFMMTLTGFTPSVVRAGVGALIFHLGALLLLPADPLTSMGIAAVLISLQGPYAVCDLAFQLSFASALGVTLAAEVIGTLRPDEEEKPGLLRRAGHRLASWLLPAALAALFTLPVLLVGGLPVSGASLPANMLSLPFVGPGVVLGLLAGACGFAPGLDFAARAFSLAGGLLAKLLNAIAAFCAALPFARLPLRRDYTLWVLAAGAFAFLCLRRLQTTKRALAALCALTLLAAGWGAFLQAGTVEVAVVGSAAQPCLVAVQSGQAAVLYRGGASNAEAVEDYLLGRGIRRARLVVDLRAGALSLPPEGETVISVSQLSQNQAKSAAVCGIMVTAARLRGGSLALVQAGGYTVAMPVGSAETGTPVKADVAVTGQTPPGNLRAEVILTRAAWDWQADTGSSIYYAPRTALLQIRPGLSAVLKGGSYAIRQDTVG